MRMLLVLLMFPSLTLADGLSDLSGVFKNGTINQNITVREDPSTTVFRRRVDLASEPISPYNANGTPKSQNQVQIERFIQSEALHNMERSQKYHQWKEGLYDNARKNLVGR